MNHPKTIVEQNDGAYFYGKMSTKYNRYHMLYVISLYTCLLVFVRGMHYV